MLAECRITAAQIKEKALDVFELATKKHSALSREHIYDEFDENGMPRASYKVRFKKKDLFFERIILPFSQSFNVQPHFIAIWRRKVLMS